jgi:hypothetical protein
MELKILVELLGPRGIGKTTLVETYMNTQNKDGWQSLSAHLGRSTQPITPLDLNALEQQLLELRLANILNGNKPTALELYHSVSNCYQHMAATVDFRRNGIKTQFLADEHLFQLFVQEFGYVLVTSPEVVVPLLKDRAFAILTRNENAIFANQKQREAYGVYRPFYSRESEEQQRSGTLFFNQFMPKFLEFLKTTHTPFIEINLDLGMENACFTLKQFLSKLTPEQR